MTPAIPPEDVRQQLYEILRTDTHFDDKARESLELATEYLRVENAHITRIDQDTNHWEAVITTDTLDGETPQNLELDLRETYCREVIGEETKVAFHDAPNQGWAEDPAFKKRGLNTYLGIPLFLKGEPYGTVCFVADEPRSEPFSDDEILFAEQLSVLIERELERDQIEADLTRQTNLATVLNRVLRHNLRNDISVIRGNTQLMAEQTDDRSTAETVLSHIDDLLHLSEKARELEAGISGSSERRHTEIGGLIEDIANSIEKDYPSASISITYDEDIHVGVLSNFDRAIEELIENAVKHSGDNPSATVAIEKVPNAVEIRITDNGPGLPEPEIKVLETGTETPLSHGSGLGLWLAHWIVTSHEGSINPTVTDEGTTLTVTIPRKPAVGTQRKLTKLTRTRDKYKAAFEQATDSIALIDDEGNIIDANSTTGAVFGMDTSELIGRPLAEFLPEEFAFKPDEQESHKGDVESETLSIIGADGEQRVLEYSLAVDVVPGQHLFVSRDITERKQRERRYNAVFNQTYQFTGLLEPDGTVIEANDTALEFADLDREEVIGKPLWETDWWPKDEASRQTLRGAIDRAAAGEFVRYEVELQGGDETAIIDFSIRPVTDDQDTVVLLIPEGRDITDRKEREREISALKERYETLLGAAPDPVVVADAESGEIIEVNDAAEMLFEMPGEEIIGQNQSDLHPQDKPETYRKLFEEHIKEGGTRERLPDGSPIKIVTDNGNQVPVAISIATVSLPGGPVTYGIFRDVSERLERERQIEHEKAKFQGVFENSFDAMVIADDDGRYIDVNESATDLFGVSEDELLGRSIAEFAPEDFDFAQAWKEFQESDQERGTFPLVRANGDKRIVEFAATRDIVPGQHLSILRDITERKEREQTLAEKTRRLEAIVQNTDEAIYVKDTDGYYQFINDKGADLFDLSPEEVVGKHDEDLFSDESAAEIRAVDKRVIESGKRVSEKAVRFIDGEKHVFLDDKYPSRDENGDIIGVMGISRDISQRQGDFRELEQ